MGFWDSFKEGLSAATHVISTASEIIGTTVTCVGAVAKLVGVNALQLGDAPTICVIRANLEGANKYLVEQATGALGTVRNHHDLTSMTPEYMCGVIKNKRVVPHGMGDPGTSDATPPIYFNLASIIAQTGAPPSGSYNGVLCDNAEYAANALMLNSQALDPRNAAAGIQPRCVILRAPDGSARFKVAHAYYNLKMDDTGLNDICHSVFAYGVDTDLPAQVWADEMMGRFNAGLDYHFTSGEVALAAASQGVPMSNGLPGWKVAVNLGVRTLAMLTPLATQIQILATQEHWTIQTSLLSGTVLTLTLLTTSSPTMIQPDIIGYFTGTWGNPPLAPEDRTVVFQPDGGVNVGPVLPAVVPMRTVKLAPTTSRYD